MTKEASIIIYPQNGIGEIPPIDLIKAAIQDARKDNVNNGAKEWEVNGMDLYRDEE